jgi:hypothetical protein
MGPAPPLVADGIDRGAHAGRQPQLVMSGDDGGFPSGVTPLDREPDGERLEVRPKEGEIVDFLDRVIGDIEALVGGASVRDS